MDEDKKNSLKIKCEEIFHDSVNYLQNSDHFTKYQNLHVHELRKHMALIAHLISNRTSRLVQ